MDQHTQEKLAASLTAESTGLLPYLPYLLQDLWELGASPAVMLELVQRHVPLHEGARVLDLCCGKGAVAIHLAKSLRVAVTGIDAIPEFIAEAQAKAAEHGVEGLCTFITADAREAVLRQRGYDATVFGAAGDVLGPPRDTLQALKATVKEHGCILLDDAYLLEDAAMQDVRYQNYAYPTLAEWEALFDACGLDRIEMLSGEEADDAEAVLASIDRRAAELTARHPEHAALFAGYVQSQRDEYYDLDHTVEGVTWLLRKR